MGGGCSCLTFPPCQHQCLATYRPTSTISHFYVSEYSPRCLVILLCFHVSPVTDLTYNQLPSLLNDNSTEVFMQSPVWIDAIHLYQQLCFKTPRCFVFRVCPPLWTQRVNLIDEYCTGWVKPGLEHKQYILCVSPNMKCKTLTDLQNIICCLQQKMHNTKAHGSCQLWCQIMMACEYEATMEWLPGQWKTEVFWGSCPTLCTTTYNIKCLEASMGAKYNTILCSWQLCHTVSIH